MRIESLQGILSYFPDIDGYWKINDLIMTENEIASRLPADPEAPIDAQVGELLTQLARVQSLRGDQVAARNTLERVGRAITETPLDGRVRLRWLLEQGRFLSLSRMPSSAHELFVKAWTLATESKQIFFAIDAALMLFTINPPKHQNTWLQKALALAEESNDPLAKSWLAHLYLLLGWQMFDARQVEKALECFDRALKEPVDVSGADPLLLNWSRSRALRTLGRIPEALALQESILGEMRQRGKVNGHVYLEIAECQQLLNRNEDAKANFELAFAELSIDSWYADNRGDELSRMKYLSKKKY